MLVFIEEYVNIDNLKEKIYRYTVEKIEEWKDGICGWQAIEALKFLKNYKDSYSYSRRCQYASTHPLTSVTSISEEKFTGQAKKFGSNPQPRTVIVVGNDIIISENAPVSVCSDLKSKMKGNIFFTEDASEAHIAIFIQQTGTLWKTFQYREKETEKVFDAQYYNMQVTIKVNTKERCTLYNKSWTGRFSSATDTLYGGATHSRIQRAPVSLGNYTIELVRELDKYFMESESKPYFRD